jgi:DNA-binding NtrC family response regulator
LAHRILIVDDEPAIRFGVRDFLEAKGFDVTEAEGCQAAEAACRSARFDAVLVDYLLADGNALDLLPRLKATDPSLPVVILTGHATIDLAVRAIKEGAEHLLTKPVEMPTLVVILERVLEQQRARKRQLAGKTRQARSEPDPFLGQSTAIRALSEEARKVSGSDLPVLVTGETGSGKGVLAAWLHNAGARAEEAFVDLNCAGLSKEFLETELFGHEKGAFTGAVQAKNGLLEVAHKGTVFLDEIGDMDAAVQPKLLKVLEEKRFRRLGDVRDRQVDVRLIAATHHDLQSLVRDKKFRSDLYFRISTLPLRVPSLRERAEDIPVLAEHFLERISADMGRGRMSLSPAATSALAAHSWPGNLRELRNTLERAALLASGSVLEPRDLRFEGSLEDGAASGTLEDVERQHIERVLREEAGQVERAARRLGIPRSTLYQRIKQFGIARGSGPE